MNTPKRFRPDDPGPLPLRADAAPQVGDAETAGPIESKRSQLPLEPSESAVRRLEDELAQAREQHLRLAAEFDNFKKRVARERVEAADRAQAALAVKLLDVLDDLDRVIAGGGQGGGSEVMQQAVLLIERKLKKELEAAGLERIDPVGAPFDPSVHEAVSVVPLVPGATDHTVSSTFQAGYRFKGQLIRPARVQVYSSEGHA